MISRGRCLVVAPADRAVAADVWMLVAALVVGIDAEVPDVNAELVEGQVDLQVADPDLVEFDAGEGPRNL